MKQSRPNLTVIAGGGKSQPAKESVVDKFVTDHLFMVLPAPTRADIAERLSLRLNRPVDIAQVAGWINHTRKHSQRLGWTVCHAKRGINESGEDQFNALLINADGTYISDVARDQCDQGMASTLRTIGSTLDHAIDMYNGIAARSASPNQKRLYKHLARSVRQAKELNDEALEEYA